MKVIDRDIKKYSALSPKEQAAAAVTLASGCSIGAYYEVGEDGRLYKKSGTIGIYEKSGAIDPFTEESLDFSPNNRHQFPIYGNDGRRGKQLIGVVLVNRGANIFEQDGIEPDKRRIAEFIADIVAPYLQPGTREAEHTNARQLVRQFQALAEINEEILAKYAKPNSVHPETLHTESVSELMRITLREAQSDMETVAGYRAGYRIHDMAKICTIPASMLMPEVNQGMDRDSPEKKYFAERNLHHPSDLMILFPFADKEIIHNIALHHLAISSDTKNKAGLPAGGVPDIAKYGRVADVFAAIIDHARYPDIEGQPNPWPAVSAEAALRKIFERAKTSSDDIPLEQLGQMVAAGVFDMYVKSRKERPLLQGGVRTDAAGMEAVQAEILAHFEAQGKSATELKKQLHESLKLGRIRG